MNDDTSTRLLRLTPPRPGVAEDRAARVRDTVYAEWKAGTRQRQSTLRRRMVMATALLAAAAAILLIVRSTGEMGCGSTQLLLSNETGWASVALSSWYC